MLKTVKSDRTWALIQHTPSQYYLHHKRYAKCYGLVHDFGQKGWTVETQRDGRCLRIVATEMDEQPAIEHLWSIRNEINRSRYD